MTSQIFANIYLNELDRFVIHNLRPQAYIRYGDDFIIIDKNQGKVDAHRLTTIEFLATRLKMDINPKNDIITSSIKGLKFLGVEIFPKGSRLKNRNWNRAKYRLNNRNIGSYWGIVIRHCSKKKISEFLWKTIDFYE